MGETAVAMPRPADSSVSIPAPREALRSADAHQSASSSQSTPSQADRLKIKETEAAALAATNREIAEAKARSKSKTETPETISQVNTAPPATSEVAPQLPPGVTQTDIARLQSEVKSGARTPEQAQQALEELVNKAMGVSPSEAHKTPPVPQKMTVNNEVKPTSPKTSSSTSPPPVEHKTENSFLSKIKNIAEKIFSIPTAIWRFLTAWITK